MPKWEPTHVVIDSECGGREGAFVKEHRGEYFTQRGWERNESLSNGVPEYFRPIRPSDTQADLVVRLRELAKKMAPGENHLTIHEAANVIEAGLKRDTKVHAFVEALNDLTDF